MTLPELAGKSNAKVSGFAANFYAEWRLRSGVATVLRDDCDSPPERLLQAVWQHQRLRRDQLRTLDGQTVRVLHPGFGNAEGGPDFRGALLQFGDDAPRTGDVEVDLRPANWRAHGHDRNPAFQNVILHAVWDGDHALAGAPVVMPLRQSLDAPLGELSLWLEREPLVPLAEALRGKCSVHLRALPPAQLTELLHAAAQVRFRAKATQLQARARQAGWDQALWEGLFRALGYKHNTWPMQCLAESRSRWFDSGASPFVLQARLLGLSGLLPVELTRAQAASDGYLRRVWDQWWRERDQFSDCLLPRTAWRFHGLRPANHPQRRLALAAQWLNREDFVAKLERWCAADLPDPALPRSLLQHLQAPRDEFWSWHWTFRSARLARPQPLLGATRVTDLAVNVILPWLWTRADAAENRPLQRVIEQRARTWPAAEDNGVLRLARVRLLGSGAPRVAGMHGAAAQQGLMQIVRDFCDHSNAVCDQCQFPGLVQSRRV